MERLPPIETLTTQYDGQHWHARYPSALRTLCSLAATPNAIGRNWPPTCRVCVMTAVRFDEIDGSVPRHWGWEKTAA